MATISGSLLFDNARAGVSSPSMPGIAGVPVVLQNTATNATLAVLTDANGRYTFLNVPNGSYRIVEAYGTAAGPSPGDFSQARAGSPAVAATPPISFAPSASPAANQLDAVTPNPLNTTVTGPDITGQDILNSPVQVPADIAVTKEPDVEIATIGDRVNYALTVSNNGPGLARNIALTDQVPSSLQNVQYSADGGATWNAWTGEFRREALASGSSFTVLLRGVVASSAAGAISNAAAVTASTTDPNSANNSSVSDLPVDSVANLGITKLADRASVRPGETITYTITTTNSGPGESRSVTVTDNIPLTLSNAEYSADNGATWRTWPGSLTLGTMANGASSSILLRAVVSQTATGSVANIARVDSFTPDPVSGNTRSYIEVPISTSTAAPSADLSVTKQADKSTVLPGDTLTYTLTVRNGGPDAAGSVVLTDNVPPALTNVQYSPNNGASWQPWNGSLRLGMMASGASSVTLLRGVVASGASGSVSNSASVSSATADPASGNNSVSLQTPVTAPVPPSADLSVTKQADRITVRPGDTLTYTLTVRNAGPDTADSVVLTDNVDSSLTNAEYSTDGGASWRPWNGSLALGAMANGASSVTLLRGVVASGASGRITNAATVSGATDDPAPGNNDAALQTTIEAPVPPSADLSVAMQADKSAVRPGDTLTYTLTVRNAGPNAAASVVLTDNVASSMTNAEYSTDGGASWRPWNGSLALGVMSSETSSVTLLRGVVASNASGSVSNTATVSGATADPASGNNGVTLQTPIEASIPPSADLSVAIQADRGAVRPGDTLTYTLTVRNSGPGAADSVVLSNNVTSALTNAEYSTDGGASWRPWSGSLALGSISNGASSVTLLRGIVASGASGRISSAATVSGANADPASGNNGAALQTIIEAPAPPSADLSVAMQADRSSARPGDILTYTLTIRNSGPSAAASVVLTDNLASSLTNAEYSTDGGASWRPWNGSLALGVMASGTSSVTLLRGVVASSATGVISNAATVSGSTADPASGNNGAAVQTAVEVPRAASADLSIAKQADKSAVRPGDTLTYTLTVRNGGPDAADSVVLTDNLASSLTGAEYSTDGGASWRPWNGSLALGAMANGASSVTLLRGVVASSATGVISNAATVSGAAADPAAGNNSAAIQTAVEVPATPAYPISLTKTICPRAAVPSCRITFTISVANAGTAEVTDVLLTDEPPGEIRNVCYSLDGGSTWRSWPGELAIGSLPAGGAITVALRGIVGSFVTRPIKTLAKATYMASGKGPYAEQTVSIVPIARCWR